MSVFLMLILAVAVPSEVQAGLVCDFVCSEIAQYICDQDVFGDFAVSECRKEVVQDCHNVCRWVGGGTTSGGGGGLDSMPLWMFLGAVAVPQSPQPPPLWKYLSGAGLAPERSSIPPLDEAGTAAVATLDADGPTTSSLPLAALVPESFQGLPAVEVQPADVIGSSNAEESIGIDYVSDDGAVNAVILGFRTRHDVYAHSWGICERARGAVIESLGYPAVASPGTSQPAAFWEATGYRPDSAGVQRPEVATGFSVFVSGDGRSFVVDSHWLGEQYPTHPEATGEVLSFEVWGADEATTRQLRDAILGRLAGVGTLQYLNLDAPPTPEVIITSGDYEKGAARIGAINAGARDHEVLLTAVAWSAAGPQFQGVYRFAATLQPGLSSLTLPLRGQLNAVVYLSVEGVTTDAIYVADGYWFSSGDAGAPPWDVSGCPPQETGGDDLIVAGCGHLSTPIPADGWRSLGRALTTQLRAAYDASEYPALSFFVSGSGEPARVALTSVTEDGTHVTRQALFATSPAGRQLTVPFEVLTGGSDPDGFSPSRLFEITWSIVGGPYTDTDLTIGNVYFTRSLVVHHDPLPHRVEPDVPLLVNARVEGAELADLYYKHSGEPDFVRVPMGEVDGLWSAEIPPQPAGVVLEYYIVAAEAAGRGASSPLDAPSTVHRVSVGCATPVLVADFEDSTRRNEQDGVDWSFGGDSVVADYSNGTLDLTTRVEEPGSFNGHVLPFARPFDASSESAVAFDVWGEVGGEMMKVGLGSGDTERKVLVSRFLRGGIGTSPQTVRVPLEVFGGVDLRRLDRVVFAFENRLGGPSPATVHIDDVRLETTADVLPIPVANFDDHVMETAFGRPFSTVSVGDATIDGSFEQVSGSDNRYRVVTAGQAGSWSLLVFDLGAVDVRSRPFLAFSLLGGAGSRPNLWLVSGPAEDETRRWVDLGSYLSVTDDAQEVSIPLEAAFATQGIDLSQLARIELGWEWRDFSESIAIDEIAFTAVAVVPQVRHLSMQGWTFASANAQAPVTDLSGRTLSMLADVSAPDSFGGQALPFAQPLDASSESAVAFEVWGEVGGEMLKVGLGSGDTERKVLVSRFLRGGIGTSPQTVRVPLEVFGGVDLRRLDRVVFVFENRLGGPSPATVHIDDLRLETTGDVLPIPVANFDDHVMETAFGRPFSTASVGDATIDGSFEQVSGSDNRYRVVTAGQTGSWSLLVFDLGAVDVRSRPFLTFSLLGGAGSRPNLWLVSGPPDGETRRWVDLGSYLTVTDDAQEVSIPLEAAFAPQGIDLSQLARIELGWEWRDFSESIAIDDLTLIAAPD